jgi:hypothetical protein
LDRWSKKKASAAQLILDLALRQNGARVIFGPVWLTPSGKQQERFILARYNAAEACDQRFHRLKRHHWFMLDARARTTSHGPCLAP